MPSPWQFSRHSTLDGAHNLLSLPAFLLLPPALMLLGPRRRTHERLRSAGAWLLGLAIIAAIGTIAFLAGAFTGTLLGLTQRVAYWPLYPACVVLGVSLLARRPADAPPVLHGPTADES